MVNVDEVNESIKKFSQVIDGLNRLDDTYLQVRETRERLELGIDKVREISAKQNEMVSEVKLKLHDMQMDTNRKIDGMQENMRDKLSLVETSIKNCVVDSQKELAQDIKNQLDEMLEKYLDELRDSGIDALIVSDIGVFETVKRILPQKSLLFL